MPTSPHVDSAAMVFFLHIPRTAGRTYHACFLKVLHRPHSGRLRCLKDALSLGCADSLAVFAGAILLAIHLSSAKIFKGLKEQTAFCIQ